MTDELNAQGARSRCQSKGFDLVTIQTQAENELIKQVVAGKFYMQI